eukprot:565373-Pelagomonas_calceolata.AAC.2
MPSGTSVDKLWRRPACSKGAATALAGGSLKLLLVLLLLVVVLLLLRLRCDGMLLDSVHDRVLGVGVPALLLRLPDRAPWRVPLGRCALADSVSAPHLMQQLLLLLLLLKPHCSQLLSHRDTAFPMLLLPECSWKGLLLLLAAGAPPRAPRIRSFVLLSAPDPMLPAGASTGPESSQAEATLRKADA